MKTLEVFGIKTLNQSFFLKDINQLLNRCSMWMRNLYLKKKERCRVLILENKNTRLYILDQPIVAFLVVLVWLFNVYGGMFNLARMPNVMALNESWPLFNWRILLPFPFFPNDFDYHHHLQNKSCKRVKVCVTTDWRNTWIIILYFWSFELRICKACYF